MTATAGFYVRALARDLGERLGCGGHLAAAPDGQRRVQVSAALPLDEADGSGGPADRLIAPADALSDLPAVGLTPTGLARAAHGNWLGPEHLVGVAGTGRRAAQVRLMAPADGWWPRESRGGVLHPVVVLG